MQFKLNKCWHFVAAAVLGSSLSISAAAQDNMSMEPIVGNQPAERLTGGHKIPAEITNRVYVLDAVFHHLTDSRVHVFDGDTGTFLGMIPTNFNGHMQVSHDGKKIYTVGTYHGRMAEAKRQDVVEIWDADGLSFEKEILLPVHRVQGLNYRGMFRQTADGKFMILQNASPAISVSIVDAEKGEFASELTQTAGCWSVNPLPNRPRSFTTICGDGSLLTIDLADDGTAAKQQRTSGFFSPKDDPIFITPGFYNNKGHFVSFYGNVHVADFNNDDVKFDETWSLLSDEDRAEGWAPGGYNLLDVHEGNKRLYVLMHSGSEEGTHKNPAEEMWIYDLESKKRVARMPGMDILSISIDQDNQRLLGIDGGNVHIFDISEVEPKLIRTIENAGETSLQAEPHPNVKGG